MLLTHYFKHSQQDKHRQQNLVILLKYAKHHQILVQTSQFILKERREEIQAARLIKKCMFSSHSLECI